MTGIMGTDKEICFPVGAHVFPVGNFLTVNLFQTRQRKFSLWVDNRWGNVKTDREIKYRQEIVYLPVNISLSAVSAPTGKYIFDFPDGRLNFLDGMCTLKENKVSSRERLITTIRSIPHMVATQMNKHYL
jgi:hypothetical protein